MEPGFAMDETPPQAPKVLVIDDSDDFRSVVARVLRLDSFRVIEAADGQEGVIQARRSRPDLILLDVSLPGPSGFSVLEELGDDPLTRPIPVIFVSATDSAGMRTEGLDLGAVDFLSKAIEPAELRARVRVALRTKTMLENLERKALVDGLTGLGNRHALTERLAVDWEIASRRGSPLSVLLTDLDGFKGVNDRLGHEAGDRLLREAARVLQLSVRAGDFLARYGGDEFVVIAHDCDLAGGISVGERFRGELGRRGDSLAGPNERLVVSVGVAVREPGDDGPDAVLRRADRALYQAKGAGRDCVWSCVGGVLRSSDEFRGTLTAIGR